MCVPRGAHVRLAARFEQGQLTDGRGETVDATRAVIIMTTNCGQDVMKAAGRELATAGLEEGAALVVDDKARRKIVSDIRTDVLRDICDGRWENLGRLGAIVPFMPLDGSGREDIVRRQLANVAQRLQDAGSPAALERWSDAVVPALIAQWDHDLGGRSTRDFIEENVVEAIAEALDGCEPDGQMPLELDVEAVAQRAQASKPLAKFVCRPL